MGAKTTDQQLTLRRQSVKCPICERKFLNVQALKSHHKFLHTRSESDVPKRVPFKNQVETRQTKKRLVPLSMLKRVTPLSATKQTNKIDVKNKSGDLAGKQANTSFKEANLSTKEANVSGKQANVSGKTNVSARRANILSKSSTESKQAKEPSKPMNRPEYECPVCATKFPVYFTAFRHIQQNHCIDEKGEKVPPNSPQLVKPIRIEVCATCNKQIRSTEQHVCQKPQSHKDQYYCLGCAQVFNGLVLFQHHIRGLHGEEAQNYFFPSREEFTTWKKDLEQQSNIDFVKLNVLKSKEMYHCSHQPPSPVSKMNLCPCSFIVREYTKGVHVCFFKKHHGHTLQKEPVENFTQYCINLYVRETEDLKLEAEDDNDLYLQFKKMITCIVFDAAKVDITTLKELLGKALEMTSILKHFEGDDRNPQLISKCLTDTQISKSLETLKSSQNKRKLSPLPKETKKVESKKSKKDSPTTEKLVENGVSQRQSRSSPALNKSVSFNKSLQKKVDDAVPEKKKIETPNEKKKQEVIPEKKKQEEIDPPMLIPRSSLQSPSSFNDSYKNFVDQNFKCKPETSTPKLKTNVRKKEVMKTKMGQFKSKPNILSPKQISPKNTSPKQVKDKEPVEIPKIWKPKADIKYEVKEQENDCNILILKI